MENQGEFLFVVGNYSEGIVPERMIANFLYANQVRELSFSSFFNEFKKELKMETIEDKELLIECIALFIKEDYEKAVSVLERCKMERFELPTLSLDKKQSSSIIEAISSHPLRKQVNPYLKENSVVPYKESQNAKKYYKRKRYF